MNNAKLRQMIANYLESHSDFYHDFMHQPIASNNPYNADTEAPTAEDAYINTIVDPVVQTQLRWNKYLRWLKNGAWGDSFAIAAICNMFNITINVLHVDSECIAISFCWP